MAVGPRFKGIRHAAGWDASDQVRNSHTNPTEGLLLDATFRNGKQPCFIRRSQLPSSLRVGAVARVFLCDLALLG